MLQRSHEFNQNKYKFAHCKATLEPGPTIYGVGGHEHASVHCLATYKVLEYGHVTT